jgi:hypothetical protein
VTKQSILSFRVEMDCFASLAMTVVTTAFHQDSSSASTTFSGPSPILRGAAAVEEGRLQLDDPIERFTPQLANRRVLRSSATSLDEIEYLKTRNGSMAL